MGRHLLMQSLLGHLQLLAEKHPNKANTQVARRMRITARKEMRPRPVASRKAA